MFTVIQTTVRLAHQRSSRRRLLVRGGADARANLLDYELHIGRQRDLPDIGDVGGAELQLCFSIVPDDTLQPDRAASPFVDMERPDPGSLVIEVLGAHARVQLFRARQSGFWPVEQQLDQAEPGLFVASLVVGAKGERDARVLVVSWTVMAVCS